MEYYSAMKKKETLTFATRMNLKGIVLREISQTEKDKLILDKDIWSHLYMESK